METDILPCMLMENVVKELLGKGSFAMKLGKYCLLCGGKEEDDMVVCCASCVWWVGTGDVVTDHRTFRRFSGG